MSSKILDDMRDVMRRRHYSIRTERSYCQWVKRFVLHFNMKSRDDLSEGEKKRVHDIDFDMKALTVRSGKGDKDRVTTFPYPHACARH